MKTIIVIAKYEVCVPENIAVSQIQNLVEKVIRDSMDCFRIFIPDCEDEDEQEPLFELKDVMCGTVSIISIGGE